jgi:signal transduction histidine kinase
VAAYHRALPNAAVSSARLSTAPAPRPLALRRAGQPSSARLLANAACLTLAPLAATSLLVDLPALHRLAWYCAVLAAAAAALLALGAAEHGGVHQTHRWQLQAVAAAATMLMLMAAGPGRTVFEPPALVLAGAAATALLSTATAYRAGQHWSARSLYRALDAGVVAVSIMLAAVALGGAPSAAGALGMFAAAAYGVAIATRGAARLDLGNPDALLLAGAGFFVLYAAGQTAEQSDWSGVARLAAPGVALLGALCLARSAWSCLGPGALSLHPQPTARPADNSRLRLVPAVVAGAAIAQISAQELGGGGTRIGFFGVVLLFALIVGRLLVALVDNRALLQRVESSGMFEAKLRDLGAGVAAAPDRRTALAQVCRIAQQVLGADTVLLWMVDPATDELEAVEAVGAKRRSLLNRRLPVDDPTSLAARVVRTGRSEFIRHVATAGASNPFLNVLLRAQAMLAVPIAHGSAVHGALVCVDSHDETAYGPAEQAKAELLASQVAVALDNAYQHALQRRRLEELSALYEFAQSAHVGLSGGEIVRQLLPILKHRLSYANAAIWLRDSTSASLRLVVSDGPGGEPFVGPRPSPLALRAFATSEPAHAGLAWADADADVVPARPGMRSQIAVPMVLKRRVVGVVDLESQRPNAYSLNDERLLVALANHAALAVDNLDLLEEARTVAALRELDRLKTELLSTVSHELRTPLGSIKGYATTLLTHERRLRREERREFLEIIDSEADRLRELIENLLDMSRLEAGVLRIDRAPVLLRPVAEEATRKLQLAAPGHTVVLAWPVDEPVLADSRRIYQVLQNLLSNAVKYSPDGGRIELVAEVGARELVVSVRDTGLGMPRGELDRIFDRFHRIGGERAQRIGGTGLGLAICKGLVEAHGGRIWAESEGEGKGSTFRFTLPLGPRGAGNHHHDEESSKSL